MPRNDEDRSDEPMSADERALVALSRVPSDVALMRMENEQIMTVALARPRDMVAIKDELFAMVNAYPKSAEEAIYRKPVGSVFAVECECGHRYEWPTDDADIPCPRCDKVKLVRSKKVKKFARNLSIRSAENIRVAYKYNRVSTSIDEMGEDRFKITATFVDYGTGNTTQQQTIVTPFYKARRGGSKRIDDDRFFGTILKAHESKVIREVVLRSIPGVLKAAYFDHCEKVADGLLTEGKMDEIIELFATKGVSLIDLENHVGRPRSMVWTKDDRRALGELWVSLNEGHVTPDDLKTADDDDTPKTKTAPPDDKVKADDMMGRKPAETTTEPAKTEKPAEPKEPAGDSAAKTPPPDHAAGMLGMAKGWINAATDLPSLEIASQMVAKMGLPDDQLATLSEMIEGKRHELESEPAEEPEKPEAKTSKRSTKQTGLPGVE